MKNFTKLFSRINHKIYTQCFFKCFFIYALTILIILKIIQVSMLYSIKTMKSSSICKKYEDRCFVKN